jgi:hypothetical protein
MSLAINNEFQQAPWQSNLPATPSTTQWGTRLTASGTPHAKGSYSTLATATYDVFGFWLGINGTTTSATRTDGMIDIAIGGAGSEQVILPEFLCGWRNVPSIGPQVVFIPIFIPRGTVIRGRMQALIASDTVDVMLFLNGGGSALPGPLFSGADAYGTSAASSIGTSHTPGNTGAESTAANIGSTLSKHYGAVMLQVQGSLATTTMTAIAYHWELQVGSTTVTEWYSCSNTTEAVQGPYPPAPFFASLPSGSQLQVRAEGSGTSIAHDVAFYCFY